MDRFLHRALMHRGFNPCCGGLAASTACVRRLTGDAVMFQSLLWWIGCVNITDHRQHPILSEFQSLLWWIGSRQPERPASPTRPWSEFQSLLWWIGLRQPTSSPTPATACQRVSILVVVDWLASTCRPATESCSPRWFQSLLWWIGSRQLCDRVEHACADRSCFNPCCGGLARVNSASMTSRTARRAEFQSLLWWIGLRQPPRRR